MKPWIVPLLLCMICLSYTFIIAQNEGNWVTYIQNEKGERDIYLLSLDTLETRQVTDTKAKESEPIWSPNREWIVFTVQPSESDNKNIGIVRPDGSDYQMLTTTDSHDTQPTWSPDSQWIAFTTDINGHRDIYKIHLDGTDLTRLTNDQGEDSAPKWSPDGMQIVYQAYREPMQGIEIYLMDSAGQSHQQLTNTPGIDNRFPKWSHDGRWILYDTDPDDIRQIIKMRPDGSEIIQLTDNEVNDIDAQWSPDDSRLVFVSRRDDGDQEIYLMNSDGTHPTRLTANNGEDWYPRWTGDGESIVFITRRDGNRELYQVYVNTGTLQRLTETEVSEMEPYTSFMGKYRVLTPFPFTNLTKGTNCKTDSATIILGEIMPS